MKKLVIHNNSKTYTTEISETQTLLEAAIVAQADPPYSCLEGVCSTCEAQIIQGEVRIREGAESSGHPKRIKTCQAIPRSELVEISYDT